MSELRTVRYHNGYHYCAAIMKRGRKHLHLVHIEDCGVVVQKLPLKDEKFMEPIQFKDKPYPLPRMIKHLRKFGRERNITQAAINILNEAREAV